MPTALPTAQELEQNHERYKFANAFAHSRNFSQPNVYTSDNIRNHAIANQGPSSFKQVAESNITVPMEVDKGTSYFRKPLILMNAVSTEPVL